MENNKGQTIFLSVIGIATLLVAIIGATFAWFSVNVVGNDKASSIIVTTAVLGNITFTDGAAINLSNIRPETSPSEEKVFTIANNTSGATETLTYQIWLNVTDNELPASAETGWFVHKLEPIEASNTGSGTTISMTEVDVPNTLGETQLGENGTLVGVASHTYRYTIQLKESNTDQNAIQGASFAGVLQVKTVATSGTSQS